MLYCYSVAVASQSNSDSCVDRGGEYWDSPHRRPRFAPMTPAESYYVHSHAEESKMDDLNVYCCSVAAASQPNSDSCVDRGGEYWDSPHRRPRFAPMTPAESYYVHSHAEESKMDDLNALLLLCGRGKPAKFG